MIRRILFAAIASLVLAGIAAAQVPGFPPSGTLQIGQGGSAPPAWNPLNGDCTSNNLGAIVCTKTNGVTFYTGLPTPSNPADAATKQYVDNSASGLSLHTAAALATTTALPANTYNNGTAGVGATLTSTCVSSCPAPTIDGTAVTLGQRLLIKNEAAPANNGIYVVSTVGTGTTPYVLTRATDANTPGTANVNEIGFGTYVFVNGGTVNGNSGWSVNSPVITIGTSAINWAQFIAGGGVTSFGGLAGVISCGPGLACAGGTVSVTTIMPNYIGGLVLSNDVSTPNTVLDTAAGGAADSTNAVMITIGAFTKSIAGAWASGSGNNGMGNGLTVAANTWYHVCLANNGGTPDEWFDTSAACANRPAGITDTKYRRIGSFKANASSQITAFTQNANEFLWKVSFFDANSVLITTSARALLTLAGAPNGVKVNALFRLSWGSSGGELILTSPDETDQPAVYVSGDGGYESFSIDSSNIIGTATRNIRTNTAAQIGARAATAAGNLYIMTYGYIDSRGQ